MIFHIDTIRIDFSISSAKQQIYENWKSSYNVLRSRREAQLTMML